MAIKVVKWLISSREKRFLDQNDAEEPKFRIKIVQTRRISQFFAQKRRKTAPKVPKTSKSPKSRFWQLVESIPLSVISQNSAKKNYFRPFLMQISDLAASNCHENTLFQRENGAKLRFWRPSFDFLSVWKEGGR